jgi:hypothetical protein
MELWVTSGRGRTVRARKLLEFSNPAEIQPVLQDIARELRAGGWVER